MSKEEELKTEPTMRYRPDRVAGATPSQKAPVYYYKVFEGDEVESCLDDGWFDHPDSFTEKDEGLSLEKMTKKQLVTYAKERFDVDLNSDTKKDDLVLKVMELEDVDGD